MANETGKKIITVPVTDNLPRRTKYGHGSKNEYIDYGYISSITVEYDLSSVIATLQDHLQTKYGEKYSKLRIVSTNDCGCRYDCSCSPRYILNGDRLETDLEYEFRLEQETARVADQEARERRKYESLKKKFEK